MRVDRRPWKKSLLCRLALVGASLAWGSATHGHHSQSEFDFRTKVAVAGTVTKLEWKSPHARLYVDVKDDDGEVVNWNFELPSPNTLMRRGWTRESLQVGDVVKVEGAPARNFPAIAIATFVRDADDKPMFTGTTLVYDPAGKSEGPE
jgi:hypothetical protein